MDETCTVKNTVDIVAKKWSLLIILSIYKGKNKTRRYNEIKKDLYDISPKILSTRLKELETKGILFKEIDQSTIPVKTFYSLSASGTDLIKIIQNIKKWGLKWQSNNKACLITNCKTCPL